MFSTKEEIQKVIDGDQNIRTRFYAHFKEITMGRIYKYSNARTGSVDVHDLFQQWWEKVFSKNFHFLRCFNGDQPFEHYYSRSLRYFLLDKVNSAKAETRRFESADGQPMDYWNRIFNTGNNKAYENKNLLQQALMVLTEKERLIFILHAEENISIADLCPMFHFPNVSKGYRVYNGIVAKMKKKIEQIMKKCGPEIVSNNIGEVYE